MQDLLAWKGRADRKPLLLHGARQVGKTYLLQKLGREHFENMVYVNLEKNLSVAGFFQDNIDPLRLLRYLEASTQEKIIPGKILPGRRKDFCEGAGPSKRSCSFRTSRW